MDFLKLQNGSDIRGVTMPGVPGEDVNLTPEAVERIAGGFVRWLRGRLPEEKTLRVSVGRDSRLSGPARRARDFRRDISEKGEMVA